MSSLWFDDAIYLAAYDAQNLHISFSINDAFKNVQVTHDAMHRCNIMDAGFRTRQMVPVLSSVEDTASMVSKKSISGSSLYTVSSLCGKVSTMNCVHRYWFLEEFLSP